jgi:hypothetical protein
VTCYMRHMDWLFDGLEIESDKTNRKRVDGALRSALNMEPGAHCPEIWAAIKSLSDEERLELIPQVAEVLDVG